jgi:hypothetical protein
MYRIELTPGEVTVFRTIEELATGVRNGLITPKARIYHSASDKWLPIEFHPHYKQALELNAGSATDAGAQRHGAQKHGAPTAKQASSHSGGSKSHKDGFTFLNVPLSPVTPLPKKKAPTPVADLPYIQDDPPAAEPPREEPVRASSRHEPPVESSPVPSQPVASSPVPSEPTASLPTASLPTASLPTASLPTANQPMAEPAHESSVDALPIDPSVHDAPIQRSPAYDLDPTSSLDRWPAHQEAAHHSPVDLSPAHETPAHETPAHEAPVYEAHDASIPPPPVERAPAPEPAPVRRLPFDPMPMEEVPLYRPPAFRSPSPEISAAHAEFEAHLRDEPIRLEEPIRDAPRARLPFEGLFAPPAPRTPALPPVSASPVLELPKISYPEFTPAEPPVAERASSGSRAKRTTHLLGAVILLAVGGYASTMVFSFGRSDSGFSAASTMADRPVVPGHASATPPGTVAPSSPKGVRPANPSPKGAQPAPSPSPKPAAAPSAPSYGSTAGQAPLPPASSGFAPALEPRAIVATAPKLASKSDAATDSSATLAPAIDMQVAAPDLQGADSLVGAPRQKGDSAMKRILRAVSGRKDAP